MDVGLAGKGSMKDTCVLVEACLSLLAVKGCTAP